MASLLALPIGCGGSDGPGEQNSDSKGGDNNPKDSESNGNADTGDTDTGGQKPDNSGSEPDPDSSGGGPSKEAVKPSEGPIDCGSIKSTGIAEGDVAPNVTLTDAGGNKTSLHDFCNDYVLIVAGAGF